MENETTQTKKKCFFAMFSFFGRRKITKKMFVCFIAFCSKRRQKSQKNRFVSLPFVVMEKNTKKVCFEGRVVSYFVVDSEKIILKEGLGFSLPFIWCVSFGFVYLGSWFWRSCLRVFVCVLFFGF